MKIDDIITNLNLRQSAFCIGIFDADIRIHETLLQALSPFSLFCAPIPERACSQAKVTRNQSTAGFKIKSELSA